MAFREQTFTDKCVLCSEFATSRCKRCDSPHCGDHAPSRKRRCGRCEEEFGREYPDVVESALAKRDVDLTKPGRVNAIAMKVGTGLGSISMLALMVFLGLGGPAVAGGLAALGLIVGFVMGMLGVLGYFAKTAGEVAVTGGAAALYRTRKRLRRRARRKFLKERKPRALLPASTRTNEATDSE